MKKLFLTIPAIMVLLLISTDFSIAKSSDIPIYSELDPEGTPPSYMLNVPQRPSAAGYCYIEALSMQIAYYRPDISAARVFAYAMFGAGVYWTDYTNVLLSGKMFTTGHTLSVTQGLGIPYILGAGSEKGYAKDMYEQASGKLFFENGQQALKYLKAAIADGRPVQVHLDMGYLEVNGVNCDPKFNTFSPGSSHLMVVVGYDKNNVYFNETISEDMDPQENEFREFPAPIPVFLESWKRAEDINKGTDLQSGPYWMLFFAKKDVSAITEMKTTDEVIADHKIDAIKNSDVILSHIASLHKNDEQDWNYQKISIARNLFADFLSELHMTAASVAYRDLADRYFNLRNQGLSSQKATLKNTIATLEDNAAERLGILNVDKNTDDDGDGLSENQGDCDDNDNSIYPGAIEIFDDSIDQNCDGHDETTLWAPTSPTGLTANAISYKQILLRWTDKSDGENGFKIERKKGVCNSSSKWYHIATVSENVNTFSDIKCQSNTRYSYRVRSYIGSHNSEYGNCSTTITSPSGTPSAPLNLVAITTSPSNVRLTWNEGSSNITGFKIYRKTNNSKSWTLLSEPGSTTFNYIDNKAENNQSTTGYSYYIQAFNKSGSSPPTCTVCVPFNPNGLTATTGSNGQIILKWEDNSDNERGFELYRKTGRCSSTALWEKVKSVGINKTTISDSNGLVSGTTYSYKVRSYCRSWGLPYVNGYSKWSNCVSLTAP